MSTHVLVTGGAGYLGAVLCEHLLDAGYRVTAVDNLMYGVPGLFHLCANPNFDFVFGDARDEQLMSRLIALADVIIPLAALVGAPLCQRDKIGAVTINRDAIASIVKLASKQQRIIIPTTNS